MIATCKKHGATDFRFIKHTAYCEECLEEQSNGIISDGKVVLPKDFKPGPVLPNEQGLPYSMGCSVGATVCPLCTGKCTHIKESP